jgi:hypothetical protein
MIEIDVTYLATERDPFDFSASIAERGANAGRETWANAVAEATAVPVLKTDAEREAARAYFKGFGAWDDAEIAAWTSAELDALVIQEAASDILELQAYAPGDDVGDIDWDEAEKLMEKGSVGGRVYRAGDRLWLYLGN